MILLLRYSLYNMFMLKLVSEPKLLLFSTKLKKRKGLYVFRFLH